MRQRVHDDLLAQQSLARSLVARLWRQRRLPPSAGAHPTSMEEKLQASQRYVLATASVVLPFMMSGRHDGSYVMSDRTELYNR